MTVEVYNLDSIESHFGCHKLDDGNSATTEISSLFEGDAKTCSTMIEI